MTFLRTLAGTAIAAAIALAPIAASARDQYERWVDVANYGFAAIEHVYVVDVDRNDWGPDLLQGDIIYPGDIVTVEPLIDRGYCKFNLKFDFADGTSVVAPAVNLCEALEIDTDGYFYQVWSI